MICKNCGAEFEDASGICPYCGREDERASKEKHRKKVRGLLNQRADIQNLPNTITRKVSKKLWLLLLIFALVLVVGVVIVSVVAKQENAKQLADEQANREHFEQLLTEKRYEELYAAINEVSGTYGYQKYVEVTGEYYTYTQIVKYCDYYVQDKTANRPKEGLIDDIFYVLKHLARLVNDCDGYVNDNKHLGNDSYLIEIKDLAYNYAAKHMGINDSIISRACEIDKKYKKNYDYNSELADYKALALEVLGN